jgi:hypothetical protein
MMTLFRKKDRGAALVELAIVIPLLVGLMVGMFEFGSAWRESALLTRLTSQTARTISSLGTNPNADRQGLTGIVATIRSANRLTFEPGSTDRVIVYKANDLTGPPAECLTTTSSKLGTCNIYAPNSIDPVKIFGAIDNYDGEMLYTRSECTTVYDGWCGSDRGWFTSNPNIPTPYVGVYIQATYAPLTGAFGERKFTSNAIYQMEPCSVVTSEEASSGLCPI